MIQIRKSEDRGHFDHGWLQSAHTFSFGDYQDPDHVRVGPLRVINEDYIQGGQGFPTHGHRDMEIITIVLEGMLEHRDSTGGHGLIKPGEVQKMSAGTGIQHSEYNALKDQRTHLYQLWIFPDQKNLRPGYEQKDFSAAFSTGLPTVVCNPSGESEAIRIHQDAEIWVWNPHSENQAWTLPTNRHALAWVQVMEGSCSIGDTPLKSGDGARWEKNDQNQNLTLRPEKGSKLLVFLLNPLNGDKH